MVMSPTQFDETWNARFNAADLEGLLSLYETDGMLVEPGGKPLVGHDAIRVFLEGFFGMSPGSICAPRRFSSGRPTPSSTRPGR